jgi:outer membrane protein assembly factor BamD (BamD/ComL family)
VLLLVSILTSFASAQSPGNLGTTRLQEVASQYLERSAFAAAVPYLNELERRLRESDESAAMRARETILFYLGVGQLQSAELALAVSTLARFLDLYPDSVHAPTARLYRALLAIGGWKNQRARHVPQKLRTTDGGLERSGGGVPGWTWR